MKRSGHRADLFSEEEAGAPSTIEESGLQKHLPKKRGFGISAARGTVDPADPIDPARASQRFNLDRRSTTVLILAACAVLAFLAVLILPNKMFDVNNSDLSLAWIGACITATVSNLTTFISGGGALGGIDIRTVRLLAVAVVGAGLAVSGAAFQGSLKNQLASPSTLGVMSGAQLGAAAFVLLSPLLPAVGYGLTFESVMDISQNVEASGGLAVLSVISLRALFSLAGSFFVVACVLLISKAGGRRGSSGTAMIIAGMVFGTVISSLVVVVRMYLQTYGTEEQVSAIAMAVTGDFGAVYSFVQLAAVAVPVIACILIIVVFRNKLDLLAFDREEAASMGLSLGAYRAILVGCCTVITAVIVAFCGSIGYVGFLIPHLARRLVGPKFGFLIPASAFLGSAFLLVVYFCFDNFSVPTGGISLVTTLVGAILFVIVIFRQRRLKHAGW